MKPKTNILGTLKIMEVGDSIVFKKGEVHGTTLRCYASVLKEQRGMRFSVNKVEGGNKVTRHE